MLHRFVIWTVGFATAYGITTEHYIAVIPAILVSAYFVVSSDKENQL